MKRKENYIKNKKNPEDFLRAVRGENGLPAERLFNCPTRAARKVISPVWQNLGVQGHLTFKEAECPLLPVDV